eukprot:TRINITY_DN8696_c0_g1_i2.p2 TRINITY_DN8696_c0_g1~~TRINITY_DN8696_c0_g1_i2.p2  ORF type:complete len:131 (-),score=14.26 TRINITY_DN8696_c0_g1_i2:63-455(-)
MHLWQAECPQGTTTGSSNCSRQTGHFDEVGAKPCLAAMASKFRPVLTADVGSPSETVARLPPPWLRLVDGEDDAEFDGWPAVLLLLRKCLLAVGAGSTVVSIPLLYAQIAPRSRAERLEYDELIARRTFS